MKNFLVGGDPELFIIDTSKNNKIISSIGLIPGEKGDPYRPEDLPEGFGVEIDNILAEFNIPPTDLFDEEAFVSSMLTMKKWISNFVKKTNPNYDIMCKASSFVDDDQLQTPEAQEIGCSPDYNVYTGGVNKKPSKFEDNMRTTGCHIHIGYEKPSIDFSLSLVRYMDMYCGIPSVLYDTDTKRRKYYGNAGSFRLCSYGMEYRVLSGYWLKDEESLRFIHKQTVKAVIACLEGKLLANPELVIDIINNQNSDEAIAKAKKVIEKYNLI